MEAPNPYKVLWSVLALALAVLLREVLMLSFVGLLLAVVISFPLEWLARLLPRAAALILTLVLGLAGAAGVAYVSVSPLTEQFGKLKEQAPATLQKAKDWLNKAERQATGAKPNQESASKAVQKQAADAAPAAMAATGKFAIGLGWLASALVVVVVLGAFLAHQPDMYRSHIKALVPRGWEPEYEELWDRLGRGLRDWLGGTLVAMALMGAFTAAGLAAAGIDNWLMLGLLTFLGTFIPYVGALASAIPGLILALAQSGDKFMWAMAVYLGVHIVEGYVVQPIVMNKAVYIEPALLLFWQAAWGILGGTLGIVVATPLLVCVRIAVGYLWIERTLHKKASRA